MLLFILLLIQPQQSNEEAILRLQQRVEVLKQERAQVQQVKKEFQTDWVNTLRYVTDAIQELETAKEDLHPVQDAEARALLDEERLELEQRRDELLEMKSEIDERDLDQEISDLADEISSLEASIAKLGG